MDKDYVRDMEHYTNDHIHVVLLHIVEYIFGHLFDKVPNDTIVDKCELRMVMVCHMVDRIELLLDDKEPVKEKISIKISNLFAIKNDSLTLSRIVCSPTHNFETRCAHGGHSSSL